MGSSFLSAQKNLQKINKLYKQGFLLAHQFEFIKMDFTFKDKNGLKDFLNVLSGAIKSTFENTYRAVSGKSGEFKCLATTFLEEGFNAKTYTPFNKVGLLLDGSDDKNLKYLLAAPNDLNSFYREDHGKIRMEWPVYGRERGIYEKQLEGMDVTQNEIDIEKLKPGIKRNKLIRSIINEIKAFSKSLMPSGTNLRINEVLVNANVNSVCGIIFSNPMMSDKSIIDAGEAIMHVTERYKHYLAPMNALALKAYMNETHNNDLPIMQYDIHPGFPAKLSEFKISRDEYNELKLYLKKNISQSQLTEEQLDKTLEYAEKGMLLMERSAKMALE